MGLFWSVAKQCKNGQNGVFPYSPGYMGLGSCKTFQVHQDLWMLGDFLDVTLAGNDDTAEISPGTP
jgi:hypothetical protein